MPQHEERNTAIAKIRELIVDLDQAVTELVARGMNWQIDTRARCPARYYEGGYTWPCLRWELHPGPHFRSNSIL